MRAVCPDCNASDQVSVRKKQQFDGATESWVTNYI